MQTKIRETGAPAWASVLLAIVGVVVIAMLGELVPRVVLEEPLGGFHYRRIALFATALSVMATVVFVWSVSHRVSVALLTAGGGVGLVAASHLRKMQILDRPLMPWDLLQWRQIVALFPTVLADVGSMAMLLVLFGCGVGVVVLALRAPGRRLSWPWRIAGASLSAAWLGALAFQNSLPFVKTELQHQGLVNFIWDQKENLRYNGLLLSTLMNVDTLFVSLPGYDEASVRAVVETPEPTTIDVAGEEADSSSTWPRRCSTRRRSGCR